MGVNVTQLLNEEIKVIVEGGDNIATKTELNAGLDLKANKVVGGVFNGMDLKAAAEKLNTDKQNVIADSGWIELSTTNISSGSVWYRNFNGIVFITASFTTTSDDAYIGQLPLGYKPYINLAYPIVRSTTLTRVNVFSNGNIQVFGNAGTFNISISFRAA